ncbi:MAG: ABC transporter substrate-binding protein [Alphaproteobacteria bacterium]|nr:ABC transporter substrate-binding protein [Alphaproteobacteria bacterium]
MRRRDFLKSSLAGATTLAAPSILRAESQKTITFVPHADLASLDPVWTTADITRNFSLAVYDTLYGYDAEFKAQPQMVESHTIGNDGRQWDLSLRSGLKFHDGAPVLARDCVATIKRWAKRYPMGQALMARTDELSALSDGVIRFRLKRPFPLLPDALAEPYCSIMPERLANTDAFEQVKQAVGSGPFKFVAAERIPGQRAVFDRNPDYTPRTGGQPSFSAGPKIVYVDRVVWNFVPDPSTAAAALAQGEVDWWENPTIDLIGQLKRSKDLVITVKDRTGEIGCLRFNQLFAPFDNVAIRRAVLAAIDQKEVMTAVAGSEPSLIKTDVGLFVPGTPMASDVGIAITRGPKDLDKLKKDLKDAGYRGEKVVVLAASTIPAIYNAAQVATDTLQRIGINVDFQAMEWGSVVARRASREAVDKGGWNIFFTYLGGMGNISPGPDIAIRASGADAWFGWPTDPRMEALREAWFDAPDLATQQRMCRDMQEQFWRNPSYVPLGMYDQPTAFRSSLQDVRDGWPQFYGVRRV